MLHHSAQKLKFIVDAARRNSLPHRRADLLAAFLLVFADEFEIDPPSCTLAPINFSICLKIRLSRASVPSRFVAPFQLK